MANITKLILPLIGDFMNRSYLDPSDKSGFVDAYIEDINRPYLRDKIFLMFRVNVPPSVMVLRDYFFRESGRLCDKRTIVINGTSYFLYTIAILEKDVLDIFKGLPPKKDENFLKIIKFWNFTDDFINEITCHRHQLFDIDGKDTQVPEEDLPIDPFEEPVGLEIEKAPSIQKNVQGFTVLIGRVFIHHINR